MKKVWIIYVLLNFIVLSSGSNDVCQDTDDIPCFGPTEADCLSFGCCWEPPNCVHSNADVEGPVGANCGVESEEKERCGDVDITKDDCLDEGCCWYTREFEGAPYCFVPAENAVSTTEVLTTQALIATTTPDVCAISEHIYCDGTTQTVCEGLGCCWDKNSLTECYHSSAEPEGPESVSCAVPSNEKIDCAFLGVTKQECIELGCCWYTREFDGAPYCFYGIEFAGPTEECELDQREDCSIIDKDSCLIAGCCWSPVDSSDKPWCYKTNKTNDLVCQKPDSQKRDCGADDADQCLTRGCCWEEKDPAVAPSCFYGLEYDGPIEECIVAPEEKVTCGDQTDADACVAEGCCWSPTDDVEQSDCYTPIPKSINKL